MSEDAVGAGARYLRVRGLYWRTSALLLAVLALSAAAGAALAYLVASPGLAKDYYSAHHTVKAVWELLVPALAAGAAASFLLGGALSALVLRGHTRRMRSLLAAVDGVLRAAGAGRIPAPPPAGEGRSPGAAGEAAAALAPLRAHVAELRRLARELQRPTLELTYRSAATADVPPRELRPLAGAIDQTARDLAQALAWFED